MEGRGKRLIILGLCLMVSPIGMQIYAAYRDAGAGPAGIETLGSARANCSSGAIETAIGRLGCQGNAAERETRRTEASSALFVRAK